MKRFLLIAVFAVAAFTVSAQTEGGAKDAETQVKGRTRVSIGFDGGLPIGDAADFYGSALGGSVKVEIPVRASLFTTLSVGCSILSYSDEYKSVLNQFPESTKPEPYIPLKAGAKYFFTKNIYGAAEIGAAFAVTAAGATGFAWAPGIGVSYPAFKGHDIDAGLRYESWEQGNLSLGQIGLHVAFKF